MTKHSLHETSQKDSTISRQTRNAFAAAVVFMFAGMVNFVISLRITLFRKEFIALADTVIVFVFVILTIFSAKLIREGKKGKGVLLLLGSFIITLALRNALIAGLGMLFGALAAILIPLISLLTLKPETFNRSLIVGVASGSSYLLFDILISRYALPYRQAAENVNELITAISIMTVFLSIAYLIALYRQHRFLLLASKLTLAMVFIVLVPIIALSLAGSISLENNLGPRQNDVLRFKANSIADNVERFIQLNKNALNSESQYHVIIRFLASTQNSPSIREQALEALRAFRRRDILKISSYAILDASGENILDTLAGNIGSNESDTDYFTQAQSTNLPFMSDVVRTDNYSIYFSAPIHHQDTGEFLGVIRAEYKSSFLQDYIDNYIKAEGENGADIFAALISEKEVTPLVPEDPSSVFLFLANSKNLSLNLMSVTHLTTNIVTPLQMDHILPVGSTAQLSMDVPGLDEGLRARSTSPIFNAQVFPRDSESEIALDVIATAEIEDSALSWSVIVSQEIKTFNALYRQQNEINTILTIIIAMGAIFFAYTGSRYITQPFIGLADVANQVAGGDLEARVIVNTQDEMGALGNAFNSMTSQINTLVSTLEERVAERTKALTRSEEQLRASIEVGKTAASLRSLSELLSQATELISQQFGYYHAGIFLIDTHGKYAILSAANSEGGHKMLAREHKLEVGAEGIVGYVTAMGEARIALDVGQDAIFFNNPDLPQTRSEMALPLIAGGKTLGALDIQSTEGEAFTQADISSLQVLADQIAISIENARLFEENRKALATVQRAYGEQSQLGWQELIHRAQNYGYRSSSDGRIFPVEGKVSDNLDHIMQSTETLVDENKLRANIPITVRGKSIGVIQLTKENNSRAWEEKDLDLAQILTAELSRAMDSARLFDETKKQADRERVVGEISDRMRETMNVESVVRLAADELYKLLDLEHITIHLNPDDIQGEDIA